MAANLLYNLLKEYSPTGMEERAVKKLVEWGEENGLKAWVESAGSGFLAPPDTREVRILLAGHIDAVEGWIDPGWQEGKVWGRGAVDAKGPLASMSVGLLLVAMNNPSCPVALAGLAGEEGDSRGARRLVRERLVPPFVIIGEPSGGNRVVVGYRGGFHVEVVCMGRGGHSSTPHLGDSALDKAIILIDNIKKSYPSISLDEPSIAVTGLEARDAWNVLPRKAIVRLDVRVPPGWTNKSVAQNIDNLAKSYDCVTAFSGGVESIRVSLNTPVPRSISRSLLRMNVKPRPVVKRGTSDRNILGHYALSISAYGPGDPIMAHSTMEVISEEELSLAAEVYKRSIIELCSLDTGGSSIILSELQ